MTMKQLKAQVFTDSDFPHHLFVRFHNGRIACAKLLTRSLHKDRGIWHYYLHKKSGVKCAISEARIECAIESHREIADIRYISKNKAYRAKKNALLLGLIRAKKELAEEHPRIDIDKYIDDAYIRILENGYIPSDYTDLKDFTFTWEVLQNGERIASDTLTNISSPAGTIKTVKLDLPQMNPGDGTEYFLSIYALTRNGNELVPKGHEVAREQFALESGNVFNRPSYDVMYMQRVDTIGNLWIIECANDVTIKIDKRNGELRGYCLGDRNLIKHGFDVTIYTRTKAKVEDLIAEGVPFVADVKSCTQDQDVVITMVGYPSDVKEVYFGKEGIIEMRKQELF